MDTLDRLNPKFLVTSMRIAAAIALLSLPLWSLSPPAVAGQEPSATVPCLDTSATLEELIECIDPYMLASFDQDLRDGFDVPTADEMLQWRQVVAQMMDGRCDTIDLGGYDWGGDYTVTTFVDTGIPYCVLLETHYETYDGRDRVTHGWGTFIYNPGSLRNLSIGAPHPISDMTTNDEAIGVFKGTRSRTFLLSGGHRQASDVVSTCQGTYRRSDAAHDAQSMFQATVLELKAYADGHGSEFDHVQFHGMSTCCTACDVHLSHGSHAPPQAGDKLLELRAALSRYHPGWRICMSGDISCSLDGIENVQGRLLNGVAENEVCSVPAPSTSGHFVHIEQCRDYRLPNDWLPVINNTWPLYFYVPFVAQDLTAPAFAEPLQPGDSPTR